MPASTSVTFLQGLPGAGVDTGLKEGPGAGAAAGDGEGLAGVGLDDGEACLGEGEGLDGAGDGDGDGEGLAGGGLGDGEACLGEGEGLDGDGDGLAGLEFPGADACIAVVLGGCSLAIELWGHAAARINRVGISGMRWMTGPCSAAIPSGLTFPNTRPDLHAGWVISRP